MIVQTTQSQYCSSKFTGHTMVYIKSKEREGANQRNNGSVGECLQPVLSERAGGGFSVSWQVLLGHLRIRSP